MDQSSESNKRQYKELRISDKVAILDKLQSGTSISSLALEYDVDVSTIRKWKHKRSELEKKLKLSGENNKKRLSKSKYDRLNEALHIWFCEMRSRGLPISGAILKGKAMDLNEMLDKIENFTCNEGWLSRWRNQYKIRQICISGEKLSADEPAARRYKIYLSNLIEKEKLTTLQIFNADETGLNYNLLPTKTVAEKSDRQTSWYKKNKDRVTLMTCSNANGLFKLPLVIIGKSAKPKALRNISPASLPGYYTNQSSAWMSRDIFKTWFKDQFVPRVTEFLKEKGWPVKAILLLDNAPSHPAKEDLIVGDIRVEYLPANTTSLIQPMDQGVIEALKRRVTIIDDDIDLNNMRAIEDGEFDIFNTTEDAPQIAGIVDERGPVDFTDKRRWKIITDDGYGDISVTSVEREEKIPDGVSPKIKTAASKPIENRSDSRDRDRSPPRKSRKDSDANETLKKKLSSKKQRRSASNPKKNHSGSEDSDFSPPRKSRKDSESGNSDFSPPRRSRKDSESTVTHKKKSSSKKQRRSASSPVKNQSGSEGSDFSPPRKSRKNSDSDEPRRKKSSSKRQRRSASSPVKNHSDAEEKEFSPPRRPRKNSDSDLSPPRNSKTKKKEREYKMGEEYPSNSRNRYENKYDKRRENFSRDSRHGNYDERIPRTRSSASPSTRTADFDSNSSRSRGGRDSHRSGNRTGENNSTEYDRTNQDRRKRDTSASPRSRRKTNSDRRGNTHFRKDGNNSESDSSPPREKNKKSRNLEPDLSPPRKTKKDPKNLDSDSSPPRRKKKDPSNLDSESNPPKKSTFKNYQEMTAETSGFGQAPVLRDRKTGRRRDLAAEARDQEEKDSKRQELEEKYAQWGKGLKQVEDRQEKLDRDLYEMTKPLARYADDADLERELKAQEREGDPMLAYMKRKQVKEGKQEPEKPKYNGPSMPNRFGIRPGYRWDGVDRSNGYEKKWFEAQNARKAVQEEAYKWSTADM